MAITHVARQSRKAINTCGVLCWCLYRISV